MIARIAPTPSGFLHPGNGMNFLLNWAIAKAYQGELLLRIDDMDSGRVRPEYVEHIFASLLDLGIRHELGPQSPSAFTQTWSQRLRMPLYIQLLNKLVTTGQVYACTCTRSQIRALDPSGVYSGTCRDKGIPLDQEGVAWRMHVTKELHPNFNECFMPDLERSDVVLRHDFVIRKKDGNPAYQLCSLADDLHFGVTDIVRGVDLLSSTVAQVYLAECLGETNWSQQIRFYHHPLKTDHTGQKISKSAGNHIDTRSPIKLNRSEIIRDILAWFPASMRKTGRWSAVIATLEEIS